MASSVTAEIRSGRVRGTGENGVARFLGLPYAAPLDGAGWFLPASPPEPWAGERDATAFGSTVPKAAYDPPINTVLADEPDVPGPDCLNLNVWTPDVAGDAPVLVWIHGGAFRAGTARIPTYDGAAFARDGLVVVSINYRLGALGFLDLGDAHTNVGLRDQILALRWVRDNVRAFGGDPARVTIMGESAGAMSVASLMSSPAAAGLFHQAILQSGAGHHAMRRETAQAVGRALAAKLGVEPTREALGAVPILDVVAASKALSADIAAQPDPSVWGEVVADTMAWEPTIDGDVLPALPIESLRAGASSGVRVLIGRNREEGRLFTVPGGLIDHVPEPMALGSAALYGFPDPAAAVAAQHARGAGTPGEVFTLLLEDRTFTVPAVRLAEARDGAPSQTFLYRFDFHSTAVDGRLGAAHAVELPFVFDTLDRGTAQALTGPRPPQALADEMHGAWVRFACGDDPGWPPYADGRAVRVFGGDAAVEHDPDAAILALWDGVR